MLFSCSPVGVYDRISIQQVKATEPPHFLISNQSAVASNANNTLEAKLTHKRPKE